MRRAVLFLSRFVLGIWIVLVIAFLSLLLSNAPSVPDTAPFASVSIKTKASSIIYLPNRIFTCTETEQQFQCQTTIQNLLLDLSLTKTSNYKYSFSNCRAFYNEQSIGCREIGQTYAPILSGSYEITDLGLSPPQLQEVKQKYWGINTLMQLGEIGLMRIGTGLSLAAGISAAFLAWFHPGKFSKAFASVACGFGMYHLVWGLLSHVRYNVVIPYRFTPQTWDWVVHGAAIVAGVGTILVSVFLLWRRFNRFIRILLSIISSMGFGIFCCLSILFTFTFFDLTATFLQNEYMLRWFPIAISSIFAIVAAILLGLHTNQSIKKFLCLSSGIGAVALANYLFVFVLLDLGYVD